jgi:hypothetical protein
MSMSHLPASWHKILMLFSLPGLLATMMIAQAPVRSAKAIPAITQAIDDGNLVTLSGGIHPFATAAADQGAAPDSLQLGRTILVLKNSAAQQAALNKLVDAQQNTKSSSYHAWLNPEQYGEQYGVAPEDIQKITQWLIGYGFQVESPMAGRNLIVFSGTHAQLRAAFHTTLHTYKIGGDSYFANSTEPQIPAALAGVIGGFSSLNNFPRNALHTSPQIVRRNGSAWQKAPGTNKLQPDFTTTTGGATYHLLVPYDLAAIYNIKPLWDVGIDGTGQTIAIVSDSNINPADVDYFRTTFGLPAKKLNIFTYGPDPGTNGDEGEADLDVEWSGAVAKNATIDLVVAGNTVTSGGIDGAAAYIINNNLATILNVSYGACESALGTSGNQYYSMIWEQAASQGITVLTASGDSGSASCDQNQPYARGGLRVSGISSTPYDVSVGGTDFHSTYLDATKYWNATNDPTTLASVKGYLPESTWNDSCANPQILAALQSNGNTDATVEALCNDVNEQANFLTTAAGSGGVSNCAVAGADASIPCLSGYPKPAWQSGIAGIPADGARDLPDVSLMAGNGIWGSFYVFCQSDVLSTGACDVNTELEGAGGTSFAAPVFAGMMALLQQKTASQQGNVNYVLYKLAAAQYAGSNASACTSSTAAAGNSCMFYDISDGTIDVPCYNGFESCHPTVAGDTIGILPGYDTIAGYDLATGLGSINAYNLIEGWATASATFLPTTTTLAATTSNTATYGATLGVTVSVAPVAPATGLPSGDVGVTTNSTTLSGGSVADVTLSNGAGSIAAELLPVGSYQLIANYAGDATFAPSRSSGLSVTITPASAITALTASRKSVQPGQKVTFAVSVTGVTGGVSPTGTVIFSDSTNGAALGSATLSGNASSVISIASVLVTSAQLQLGSNNITASYSGDNNYAPAVPTPLSIDLSGSFTTTINPGSLTLAANGTGTASVTVTAAAGTVLTPGSITLACPTPTVAGVTCSFSPLTAGSTGTLTSTLTLNLASPLLAPPTSMATLKPATTGWLGAGLTGGFASLALLILPRRRRRSLVTLSIIASCSLIFPLGCGSGGSNSPTLIATTTALAVSPSSPILGAPVVFTAKVTPATGSGQPTGSVTFTSGTTTLGMASLSSGTATFTTSALPIGSQQVIATYSGDTGYTGSASATSALDVAFSGTITITASDTIGDKSSASLAIVVQ